MRFFDDIKVAAVKIGMLACGAIVEEVADRLAFYKPRFIVLDPVLAATERRRFGNIRHRHGRSLRHLLPLATLITPNVLRKRRGFRAMFSRFDLEGMRRAPSCCMHAARKPC